MNKLTTNIISWTIALIAIFIIFRKTKLYKNYQKLGHEQFMAKWKTGIQKITPIQQTQMSVNSMWLVLIGIVIGIVSTIITKTWWLVVVLVGSFGLSILSQIGQIQKLLILKDVENKMKEMKVSNENTNIS